MVGVEIKHRGERVKWERMRKKMREDEEKDERGWEVWEILPVKFLRHRIVTTSAPGMAAENALASQIKAFEGTMFLDGLDGIL